ncbi:MULTISPECIES: M20/M25/M40 family metallo-hydrolase [unclassified Roseateles]|uniref:M20/M25/M40 family metallo-hydrolase n=1 Tax=unclassified Roseateles TaxID=2626991 RepID=UPI0006F834D6|nr:MULTISPECIES: M20/M25/M40 family metallo-hydrolase [unclassified Roseateles]KQW41279.1 peptidase M28 [Pelomonas sp. Root405]KRA68050.1 peptidase M28 [Pelomonas sp. Root662]
MRSKHALAAALLATTCLNAMAQLAPVDTADPVAPLVNQLELDKYKATIKGLTQFGDRRQGTARNRAALDWIEAQLQSYGCTATERLRYEFTEPAKRGPVQLQPVRAAGPAAQGGGTLFGKRAPIGVNNDPMAQPDEKLRALNSELTPLGTGPRESVYCTKVGATRPDEMVIVSAHMDGLGFGEAANDDGSGTALVMELARVFNAPGVTTERSIRFILWNNEESGLNGAHAYVAQRKDLQGIESPKGSGRYPEPRWLAVIQHDMLLFDHGMPIPKLDAAGKPVLDARGQPVYTAPSAQRAEADVNVEFQVNSKQADASAKLAWAMRAANETYATDYPVAVGNRMTNTDSVPFMDHAPAVSVRENERGMQIGAGWNPHWHQPTDLYDTYSDKDFLLGLNAAQTTLAAVARLTGARGKP